ncbi:glucose dehydrogenase [Trichonephila clavipes]|nr:glucose dehydrogenase [Trichonephila clavipes]
MRQHLMDYFYFRCCCCPRLHPFHRRQDRILLEWKSPSRHHLAFEIHSLLHLGGGTAGSVVANRLSEDPWVNVLLLEAGKAPPILTDIPGIARSFYATPTDLTWTLKSTPQKHTGKALRNGQVAIVTGKGLGGSSIISSSFYSRGNRKDFDAWALQGATGWSYEEVFPYFLKYEDNRDFEYLANDCPTVHDVRVPISHSVSILVVECSSEDVIVPQGVSPKHPTHALRDLNQRRTLANPFEGYLDFPVVERHQSGVEVQLSSIKTKSSSIPPWNRRTSGSYHNIGGPVTFQKPGYNPEIKDPIFEAAARFGYSVVDPNGPTQKGFYDNQGANRDGQRCSTAKAYLVPAENRTNLDIVINAHVNKIILDGCDAKGVEFDFKGSKCVVKAKKEVIMAAGTVNTAKILMLSGIGPKEHLQKLKIPVVVDLPVGNNLQDHPTVLLNYQLDPKIPSYDQKLCDIRNVEQYIRNRTGIF